MLVRDPAEGRPRRETLVIEREKPFRGHTRFGQTLPRFSHGAAWFTYVDREGPDTARLGGPPGPA